MKAFNWLSTYLFRALRYLLPKAQLAFPSPQDGKGGSRLFSGLDVAQGRGRTHLFFCAMCSRSRRDLLWVSLVCLTLGTKVALRCPRPWRGLCNSAVSSMECLKHRGNLSLISSCLVPTPEERPTTAVPYRPQDV